MTPIHSLLPFLLLIVAVAFAEPVAAQTCDRYLCPDADLDGSPDSGGDCEPSNDWTIADANAQLGTNGDYVACLRSGIYRTQIKPSRSGTSSQPIVYRAANGAEPVIEEPTDGDPAGPSNVEECVHTGGQDWIVVSGVTCTGEAPCDLARVKRGIRVRASRHVLIEGNTVRYVGSQGITVEKDGDNIVRGNRIEFTGDTNGSSNTGDALVARQTTGNLIEENLVRYAGHQALKMQDAADSAVIGNKFFNPWWRILSVSEEGFVNGGGNLLEGNRALSASTDVDPGDPGCPGQTYTGITSASQDAFRIATHDTIVRRNRILDNGTNGLRFPQSTSNWPRVDDNHVYFNAISGNGEAGVEFRKQLSTGADGNVFVDNVLYDDSDDPLDDEYEIEYDVISGELNGHEWRGNLVRGETQGEDILRMTGQSDRSLDDLQDANGGALVYSTFHDNVEDALDVLDESRRNFFLGSTSDHIDAGLFLTQVTSSGCVAYGGTETTIHVEDSGFFHPGIDGDLVDVPPDSIQLEGQSTAYPITFLGAGELRVDGNVTCSEGDGVSLSYSGSAPDLAFHEGAATQAVIESAAGEDGYVSEKGTAVSGVSDQYGLRLGDDAGDWGLVAILSFDTSSIPSNATILDARLEVVRGTTWGQPTTAEFGEVLLEMRSGSFGASSSLAADDYDAVADAREVVFPEQGDEKGDLWIFDLFEVGAGEPSPSGLELVNPSGNTQVRMRFGTSTNGDGGPDYIGFWPGDAQNASDRPRLVITYE